MGRNSDPYFIVVWAFFSTTCRKLKLLFSNILSLCCTASGVIPVFKSGVPGAGKSMLSIALMVARRLSSEPECFIEEGHIITQLEIC